MIAANTTIPTGCIRDLPIGYLYLLMRCMDHFVNQRMAPATKSSRESSADATMAKDPLLAAAITYCTSNTFGLKFKLHFKLQVTKDSEEYAFACETIGKAKVVKIGDAWIENLQAPKHRQRLLGRANPFMNDKACKFLCTLITKRSRFVRYDKLIAKLSWLLYSRCPARTV